jgi:hypothetical protein
VKIKKPTLGNFLLLGNKRVIKVTYASDGRELLFFEILKWNKKIYMVKMILKITWIEPQLGCYTKKRSLNFSYIKK